MPPTHIGMIDLMIIECHKCGSKRVARSYSHDDYLNCECIECGTVWIRTWHNEEPMDDGSIISRFDILDIR
ncbi:MAG TPA: hypothetical protein VMZ91_03620 [Candidatus Paceibacterota bacterium]|nr:hypothetical protein [Candidatus Paceibacterota bacterium]